MENQYKKIRELTNEEIKELPTCKFSIFQLERKKQRGVFNYQAVIELKRGLTLTFTLEEAEFYLIISAFKLNIGLRSYRNLNGKYRLIKGKKEDREYVLSQVMLTKSIIKRGFLSEAQIMLINQLFKEDIQVNEYKDVPNDEINILGDTLQEEDNV